MAGWTQRMTDVEDAVRELRAIGMKPTIRQIADRIGVSSARVQQIRWHIERFHRVNPPTYDHHVQLYRHWIYENFEAVLPVIRQAARLHALTRIDPETLAIREKARQKAAEKRQAERDRRQAEYDAYERTHRERLAEYFRKMRAFPPPPDPYRNDCTVPGSQLYERLRTWRGIDHRPKLDGKAELKRWNG